MARHLVAKAEVEQYMRELALPLTCLIMPVYFEDLVGLFRPQTRDGRTYDVGELITAKIIVLVLSMFGNMFVCLSF